MGRVRRRMELTKPDQVGKEQGSDRSKVGALMLMFGRGPSWMKSQQGEMTM